MLPQKVTISTVEVSTPDLPDIDLQGVQIEKE